MQATRTPPGRAPVADPGIKASNCHQPQPSPGLGTQALTMKPEEEFLSHFGDAIDDRIAEILDELLEERNAARPQRRLPQILGTAGLVLALITNVLLRNSATAAWTIWPATATICLVIAWTSRTRWS